MEKFKNRKKLLSILTITRYIHIICITVILYLLNCFFQSFPFFGVEPTLLDDNGAIINGPGEGYLVFKRPWPGIMRTILNNHKRFQETYFSKFPGYFFTGDGSHVEKIKYHTEWGENN